MKQTRHLFAHATIAALCLGATIAFGAPAPQPQSSDETEAPATALGVGKITQQARPGEKIDIYLSMGQVTHLALKANKRIESVDAGSQAVVLASYDEELGILKLEPIADGAETNLLIVSGGQQYEFFLHVITSAKVRTALTVNLESSTLDGWAPPANVPSMRPDRIDVVTCIGRIEEAEANPSYLSLHDDMLMLRLGKTLVWNHCPIVQKSTTYFRKEDLLVLKFELRNATQGVIYLHAKQYHLRIANQTIPVTVATQLSKELYPGQVDEVHLFIQGYRISPASKFELMLPAEAESLRRMVPVNSR